MITVVHRSSAEFSCAEGQVSGDQAEPLMEESLVSQGLPLVFFSGWGSDEAIWQNLLREHLKPDVDCYFVDAPGFGANSDLPEMPLPAYIEMVKERLPAAFIAVGWSLGGMIATQLASESHAVRGLVTLAANPCFVQKADWLCAMPADTYQEFYRNFDAQPEQTLKRFQALQAQGDRNRRDVMVRLRQIQSQDLAGVQQSAWLAALAWLDVMDHREVLPSLPIPQVHIFGMGDALVPIALSAALDECGLNVVCVPETGHCLPVSAASDVAKSLLHLMADVGSKGSGELDER